MNEKKIIKHLMMEIIDEVDKGLENIKGPLILDIDVLNVCFKNIGHYARMIIED